MSRKTDVDEMFHYQLSSFVQQNSNKSRKTDGDETFHYHSSRFVQQNGQWYYMTREGEERGPFETMEDAEGDLIFYIRDCNNREIYSGN